MITCEKGDEVRVTVTFDSGGTPRDPTTVTFKIVLPHGLSPVTYVYGTDVQLIRDGVGIYHVDWLTTVQGNAPWSMRGTGAVQRTAIGAIYVNDTVP